MFFLIVAKLFRRSERSVRTGFVGVSAVEFGNECRAVIEIGVRLPWWIGIPNRGIMKQNLVL